ncbi:ATP-binding protein [Kitasatospora sp. NPDC050463]|uniref:ATP-binding protein n=1 Tax=Kitasatospora sp. NPDC050463 TaxID=3155786 RepID=UPI0033C95A41
MPNETRPVFSQLALADTPNAVSWARRHTVDVLRRWRVPTSVIDTAQLVVSELTTNATRRLGPNEEAAPYSALTRVSTITLTLRLDGHRLLLLVHDYQPEVPVLKEVGLDAENGRGVFLIAHLSARWGYYVPATASGKVVWSELLLTTPAAQPAAPPAGLQRSPFEKDPASSLLVAKTLVGLRGL